ncbi:MAG: hypothetical protein M3506_01400 [Chloroflexota bacterium]|nr:hypothetical protein [Chloroflexota bacterium]
MRFENAGQFWERASGDLAAGEDLTELRQRLAPHLPSLYTFLARRSQDREEAEDLLVETLCLAKATEAQRVAEGGASLPWLLRLADRNLRARIEQHPVGDAGFAPNWVVPTARLPVGLLDGVGRLGWADRQALGLRYGDGLPVDIVAQALGADPGAGGAVMERALDAAHEAWAQTLQEYTRGAGAPPTQVIREVLPALRASASLSRALVERVWQRVGEERPDVFVPSRPLPILPRWFVRAMVLVVFTVALVIAGLVWLDSDAASPGPEPQRATRDVDAGSAPVSLPPAVLGQNGGAGTPTRRSWDQFAQDRQQFRHEGTLYYIYVIPRRYRFRLVATGVDATPAQRAVVTVSGDELPYAISRTDGRVIVGEGKRLWVQDGTSSRELIRGHFNGYRGPTPPTWGITGQLAWHPAGKMVAATVYHGDGYTHAPVSIQTVRTDTLERTKIAGFQPGEMVSALSYSPDGRFLLVTTESRSIVIDTARRNRAVRLPATVRRAYWAPSPSETRLLWIGARRAGANSPFGTVQQDGTGLTVLGTAAHTAWHPGGDGILVARFGRGAGFEFWSYDAESDRREKLVDVRDMDTSVQALVFGPDGRHLAYGNKTGLFLVHLGSGRVQQLVDVAGGAFDVQWGTASPGQPGSVAR